MPLPSLTKCVATLQRQTRWLLLVPLALAPVAVSRAQQAPAPERPADVRRGSSARDVSGREARDAGGGSPEAPGPRTAAGAAGSENAAPTRPGSIGSRAGGRTGFGSAPAPSLGEGPTCKFDATIYDVRMPVNQIGRLDIDALTEAAATPDAFEKALAALGTAQPLYRADQSVRLSGDNITIGSEVPIVTSSHVSDKGQTQNSVQYMSTGALFNLAGKAGPPGGIDLDLSIQLSAISDGTANITDNVKAAVMRKATISHKGPVQPRKPFVVVSVDAASTDKDGKAVAYIGRITIGEPQHQSSGPKAEENGVGNGTVSPAR
jgi:hypothetical protein